MIRDHSGRQIVYISGSVALPDEQVKTTWLTPEKIPKTVKNHLCEAGPKECASCGLCAFGRWWVNEHHNQIFVRK